MKKSEKDKYEETYGIFKFKRPQPDELEKAMGLAGESVIFKKLIMQDYDKFYQVIKAPEEGDWLLTHKEFGQTYQEYITSGISQVNSGRDTIYITPLCFSKEDIIDQDFITGVYLYCESFFYGMKIRLIQIDSNFHSVEAKKYEDGKMQINGAQFLERLTKEVPQDAFCLIGIVDTNFYEEHIDKNGVASYKLSYDMKNISKRTCIFSFDKFDPTSGQDKSKISKEKKKKISELVLRRVCKMITYLICSMFGLKNCTYFSCLMNGSGTLEEFDRKFFDLCPICLRKLITNIQSKGKDLRTYRVKNSSVIIDRLIKIREMLYENFNGGFGEEMKWLDDRIGYLEGLL